MTAAHASDIAGDRSAASGGPAALPGDLFTPWRDPASGVTSYLLTRRVAPLQQSFYFTNRSMDREGRYLWFYAAFPPGGGAKSGRTLAVADLREGAVRLVPEAMFRDTSPMVDPDTGEVFWCWGYSVYRRRPEPEAPVSLVGALPESVHRNRRGERLATHLTRSADGKELLLDAHLGDEWWTGTMPLDGGPVEHWQSFDRNYNHAQFSPTDPDLTLIAQDHWIDMKSGEYTFYDRRIWTLRRGERARPVFDHTRKLMHEWWDSDGRHIWYIDRERGTQKVDLQTGEVTTVWPAGTCHSHASLDGQYVVGDIGTYSWRDTGCRVAFFNTETGQAIDIVSALPEPIHSRDHYHIHPHPQFCAGDAWIVYTTTVRGGQADVAMVRVRDLVAATGGRC